MCPQIIQISMIKYINQDEFLKLLKIIVFRIFLAKTFVLTTLTLINFVKLNIKSTKFCKKLVLICSK